MLDTETTNSNGRYAFLNLSPGNYKVVFYHPNYNIPSVTGTVTDGQITTSNPTVGTDNGNTGGGGGGGGSTPVDIKFNGYEAPRAFATGDGPNDVIAADFNGDAKNDLAVSNYGSASVSVLLQNAGGTLEAAVNYAITGAPYDVQSADLNSDGNLDMVTANGWDKKVSVLIGAGNGTFAAKVDYDTTSDAAGLSINDMDGDGKLDLTVSCRFSDRTIGFFKGVGDGTFAAEKAINTQFSANILSVSDLNEDTYPDIVFIDYSKNIMTILLGKGGGEYIAPIYYSLGAQRFMVSTVNLDGNSLPEIVVSVYLSQEFKVFTQFIP